MSWGRAKVKISPIPIATRPPIRKRPIRTGPQPKAAKVLASTIGFMIGAASRKLIATETGRPLCIRRRATGTTPHSHTGKAKPSSPPSTVARKALRGIRRAISSRLTKASISPETSVPSSRKGAASMKMPRKRVVKVWSTTGASPARATSRMPPPRATISNIRFSTRWRMGFGWLTGIDPARSRTVPPRIPYSRRRGI